ncbi:MAG TPA: M56 family metallopeptidase [Candidatus Rubrimentiphilum sp.]|nr:M56 family metallopeptidase [Candidatus Rubrimentiphilum sp.]
MNAPVLFMALFNGAWQGALLCSAAFGLLHVFRRLNAATRYAIWSSLLLIALLLPAANYAFSVKPVTQVVKVSQSSDAVRLSSPSLTPVVHRSFSTFPAAQHQAPVTQARPDYYGLAVREAAKLAAYAPYALLALLAFALVRSGILGREILRMIAARRSVRLIAPPFPLHDAVRRPYAFASSQGFTTPCVLGFQPALIVIPETLLSTGNEKELLSVVLHEHEHVMRFDDIQNVLHRLAGAIGFFLPGVWLALRELAICREQICDDAAIAGAGNRYAYARTLSAMAGWIDASPVPVPCFLFKRKQLLRRIEVLLDAAVSHSLRPNLRFAATAVGSLALAAVLVLRLQVPVFAERIAVVPPLKPAVPAQLAPAAVPLLPKPRVAAALPKPVLPGKKCRKRKCPKAKTPVRPIEVTRTVRSVNGVIVNDVTVSVPVPNRAPMPHIAPMLRIPAMPRIAPMASTALAFANSAHTHAWSAQALAQSAVNTVAAAAPLAHGGGDLLDALAQHGYTNLSVDDLIALRDHGVSGLLIAGATAYFGHPSVADLIRLADHGVYGPYLAELRSAGISGLTAEDAIRMRDHGVSPALIAGLRARGYTFDADTLVKLADHGVSIMYIDSMQRLRSNGRPSLDDIIRLHDAGFTP